MKVDDRCYCFSCGATGDAIDLTVKLFNLSPKDAALKLAADFGVSVPDNRPGHFYYPRGPTKSAKPNRKQQLKRWVDRSIETLIRYRWLLRDWELYYAPQGDEDEWHSRFCQALQDKATVEYLLDELMFCSEDRLEEIKLCCGKEIQKLERRMGGISPKKLWRKCGG